MDVVFERRENLAANIWQYYFRPLGGLDFLPGQYADLHLSKVVGDPRGPSRTLSFTNLPDEPSISFVLKHFEKQSPYKQALEHLKPGGVAKIDNAMGDLVLPKSPATPLIFVAGGIGIASYVGMLKQLIKTNEQRQVELFYQLRDAGEQIFGELLEAYKFKQKEILFKPDTLTGGKIKTSVSPESLIYLSGSQTFVENLQTDLERLGFARAQIIFDYYDGYIEL